MDEGELSPCPFGCDAQQIIDYAESRDDPPRACVRCLKCHARGPVVHDERNFGRAALESLAQQKWNTRAPVQEKGREDG